MSNNTDTHTHAHVLTAEIKRNQTKRPTTIASVENKKKQQQQQHSIHTLTRARGKKSYEILKCTLDIKALIEIDSDFVYFFCRFL